LQVGTQFKDVDRNLRVPLDLDVPAHEEG
jgi:hypothetical protein